MKTTKRRRPLEKTPARRRSDATSLAQAHHAATEVPAKHEARRRIATIRASLSEWSKANTAHVLAINTALRAPPATSAAEFRKNVEPIARTSIGLVPASAAREHQMAVSELQAYAAEIAISVDAHLLLAPVFPEFAIGVSPVAVIAEAMAHLADVEAQLEDSAGDGRSAKEDAAKGPELTLGQLEVLKAHIGPEGQRLSLTMADLLGLRPGSESTILRLRRPLINKGFLTPSEEKPNAYVLTNAGANLTGY